MPAPTLPVAPMRANDPQKKKNDEKTEKTDGDGSNHDGEDTETKDGDAEGEDLVRSLVDARLHSRPPPLNY